MISQEKFVEISLQSFREINNKLDKVHENISELCVRQSVLETNYKSHVEEKVKEGEKKYKNIAAFLSVITSVSVVVTILKNLSII